MKSRLKNSRLRGRVPPLRYILSAFFVSLLLLVYLPWLTGEATPRIFLARHPTVAMPALSRLPAVGERGFWQSWQSFFANPKLPGRFHAYEILNSSYVAVADHLPNWAPGFAIPPHVFIAPGGWMFLVNDFHYCLAEEEITEKIQHIIDIGHIIERAGKKFYFFMSPDKSVMNASRLGNLYRSLNACADYNRALYLRILKQYQPFMDFSRSDIREALRSSRRGNLYFKTDTHWNSRGRLLALQWVAETIEPGITRPDDMVYNAFIKQHTNLYNRSLALREQEGTEEYKIRRGTIVKTGNTVGLDKNKWPIEIYRAEKYGDLKFITGKTLFITDSFFYHIGLDFTGYFEEAKLYYLNQTENPSFRSDIRGADRIVIPILERGFLFGDWDTINSPESVEYWKDTLAK